MLKISERRVQPNLLHFESLDYLQLILPFYSKVYSSPFLDGCIFYLSELLYGYKILILS